MRQLNSWNVGDPNRAGDEVALRPEFFCDQRNDRYTSSSKSYSVTHGAGGATTSMAVGGNDCLTIADDLV